MYFNVFVVILCIYTIKGVLRIFIQKGNKSGHFPVNTEG